MLSKLIGDPVTRDSIKKAKHHPNSNNAAVVTLNADAERKHVLHGIQFGYDLEPSGGSLSISIGGVQEWKVPVVAAGPGGFSFTLPTDTINQSLVVTLAAGGSGVTGFLNIQYTSESERCL